MKKSTCLVAAYLVVLHLVALALLAKVEAVPKIVNKIGMTVSVGSRFDGILHDRREFLTLAARGPGPRRHRAHRIGDSGTGALWAAPGADAG